MAIVFKSLLSAKQNFGKNRFEKENQNKKKIKIVLKFMLFFSIFMLFAHKINIADPN